MTSDTPPPSPIQSIEAKLRSITLPWQEYTDIFEDRLAIFQQWALNKDYFNVGVASATACIVSHPLDTVKVRLQLQGEMKPPGKYPLKYRSIVQSLSVIGRYEGFRSGLYKAFAPAFMYNFTMNSLRMCIFDKFVYKGFTSDMNDEPVVWRYLAACILSGTVGAVVASPLYLAKIQTQTQAHPDLAVGWQHQHPENKSRWALWNVFRGHRGYLRSGCQGGSAAVMRLSVASTVQLFCFTTVQHGVYSLGVTQALPNSCISGALSSIPVVLISNPLDVLCTRMYNQELAAYYETNKDCVRLLLEREGWRGFYKGALANYCRTVPHMIGTLILYDHIRRRGIQLQQLDQSLGYFDGKKMEDEHQEIIDKFEKEE